MFRQILSATIIGTVMAVPVSADDFSFSVLGHGRDVILVPGLGSSAEVMDDAADATGDVRWHLLSFPGFAGNPRSEHLGEATLTSAATAVSDYIVAQDLGCPILIGHSVGAIISVLVAATAPSPICGLVLMDAPPALGAVMAQSASPDDLEALAETIARPLADLSPSQFADWATQMAESWGGQPSTRSRVAAMIAKSDQATVSEVFAQAILTDVTPLLGQVTMPTLVLFATPQGLGLTDEMIEDFYRAAYADLPDGHFRHIPDAGHFLMLDQPAATAAAITAFLSAL